MKQVVQTDNQMLVKTTTGNPTSNLNVSNTSCDKTPDRHSVPTLNPSNIHKHTTTSLDHTYRPDSLENSLKHPTTNFEQTKQIIMDIDTLSHSPTIHYRILQELNLNDLCQYNNIHQTYLFENSNKIVNFSYILVFLKQSACYIITPDTHQWYRTNTNEIIENHKITLHNDPAVHMVPILPAEFSKINTFNTMARLTVPQTQNEHINSTCTSTYVQ